MEAPEFVMVFTKTENRDCASLWSDLKSQGGILLGGGTKDPGKKIKAKFRI